MTDHPYVWVCPGRQGGTPCIGGTRVPVSTIVGWVQVGDDATEDFGVTHPEIVVACWYATERHPKAKAWGSWRAWAEAWFNEMWSNNYDAIPLPPVAADANVDG